MAHESSDDAIWFLSGLAIGVTIGLLFAPQSGEETRHKLKKAARKGSDQLRERGYDAYEKGRDLLDRGRQFADDVADEASGIFERGRDLVDG